MRKHHITSPAVAELLDGGGEFVTPRVLLGDLTEAQALQQHTGAPYTIGQIVAHMHFWQNRLIVRLQGEALAPRPGDLEATFPQVAPGGWQPLVERFLAGIELAKRLAVEQEEADSVLSEDATTPYLLAESALHNAYHLGQIALLRRAAGLWPPDGADEGS